MAGRPKLRPVSRGPCDPEAIRGYDSSKTHSTLSSRGFFPLHSFSSPHTVAMAQRGFANGGGARVQRRATSTVRQWCCTQPRHNCRWRGAAGDGAELQDEGERGGRVQRGTPRFLSCNLHGWRPTTTAMTQAHDCKLLHHPHVTGCDRQKLLLQPYVTNAGTSRSQSWDQQMELLQSKSKAGTSIWICWNRLKAELEPAATFAARNWGIPTTATRGNTDLLQQNTAKATTS